MKASIGVWIDKSQARIISPTEILETIPSAIENRPRYEGQGKEYGRFGSQYLTLEKSKQKRLQHQEQAYLKNILNAVKSYDQIMIFGPASMKKRLKNYLDEEHLTRGKVIDVIIAEKMTDNQLVAFVREYFGELEK
jgi:hypothetical protein